ncbi:MAG: antitoxin VapB family protein [Candidatus Bathyarchaeia archaeon]
MEKTIAVSEDVYELLSKAKLPGESFSDVIRRSIKRGMRLTDIAGSKTITREDWKRVVEAFREQAEAASRYTKNTT